MAHREGHLTAARSRYQLYWQAWLPPQRPKGIVIFVHDWAEHGSRYAELASQLCPQGYAVYALDQRGHGQSEGTRALFPRFALAENDFHLLVEQARRDYPRCPLLPMGQGIGCVVALSYALKQQDRLTGVILSAATLELPGMSRGPGFKARFMSRMRPGAAFYAIDEEQLTRDRDALAAYRQDPLVYHAAIPARTLTEVFDRLGWLSLAFRVIKLPLLALHGSADQLALPSGCNTLHERYGGSDKTIKFYDGARHDLLHELPATREKAFGDLAEWLTKH